MTSQERATYKRALMAAGVMPSGMEDDELEAAYFAEFPNAEKNNAPAPKPESKPESTPAPKPDLKAVPKTPKVTGSKDDLDALAEILGRLTGEKEAPLDEARIVELIQQHSNKPVTHNVTVNAYKAGEIKLEGVHSVFPEVVEALEIAPVTMVWPYLVGPAGSGKSTLARQIAESFGIPCYAKEKLDDKFELLGYEDAGGKWHPSDLYHCMKNGGIFLFDEIDASDPNAVIAFNSAIANGIMTFPNGETVKRHEKCFFIGAGNTFGLGATAVYSAREMLDGSTRNRFMPITIGYCEALETQIAHNAAASIDPDYCAATTNAWLVMVLAARAFVKTNQLDVIISPRQSMQGAALAAKGRDLADLRKMILGAELNETQLKQIEAA